MRIRSFMKSAVTIAVVAFVAFVIVGCSGEVGGTGVTYEFKAGDSFSYDMIIDMNGTVSGPGVEDTDIPAGTKVKTSFTIAVTDVSDGVATVTYTFDSMEMTAEGQTETIPAKTIPATTLKIDEQGKVVSVEGGSGGMPFGIGMSDLPFDPSQLSSQMVVTTPEGGLQEVGQTWSITNKVPIPGMGQEVTATLQATLVALDEVSGEQIATIDYTLDMPLDIEIDLATMMAEMGLGNMMEQAGEDFAFKMSMSGKEDMRGTVKINMSRGVPVSFGGDSGIDIEMLITEAPADMIPENERGPFGMNMFLGVTLEQTK